MPSIEELFENARAKVEEHGWFAMHVFPVEDTPAEEHYAFTYSMGFERTLGAPELIVTGSLPQQVAHGVLGSAFDRIKKTGEPIIPDGSYDEILVGFEARGHPVSEGWREEHMRWTSRYYGEEGFRAVQLVWPDREGRWPWDEDWDADLVQPLLGA